MTLAPQTTCPRCGGKLTKIVRELGNPTVYYPCEHTDLFTSLKVTPVDNPWAEVVRLTNLLNSVKDTLRQEVDLAPVRYRMELARLAGTDADDAGNGWDEAKLQVLKRSWQDLADLHDTLLRLKNRLGVE